MSDGYKWDAEAAKRADVISGRITETGKYIGLFVRAEQVFSTRGTEGIEFEFKAGNQSADFLTLWTRNADGKPLSGGDTVVAIMTCLRLRAIAPTSGIVEKFDRTQNKRAQVSTTIFPELMNKPIGLLLQREPYLNRDGDEKERVIIYAPFDANTELTSSEIAEKKTVPAKLEKMISVLRDRPLNKSAYQSSHPTNGCAQATGHSQAVPPHNAMADMDDDIPF